MAENLETDVDEMFERADAQIHAFYAKVLEFILSTEKPQA